MLGLTGRMDEVRVSKVARYELDFTPRASFDTDKDTLALYHFNEGNGDVLKDSSGNNHHGKIVGAKWVNADGSPIAADQVAAVTKITPHEKFPVLKGHEGPIKRIRFLPDGKQFVSVARDGTARLWNAETGEMVRQFASTGADKTLNNLAISPDGTRLAMGGSSYRVYLFDIASGKLERFIQFKDLGHAAIGGLAFSADGASVFVGNAPGVLHEFRVADGSELSSPKIAEDRVMMIEPLPDNERVLVEDWKQPSITLWNRTKQQVEKSFTLTEKYDSPRSITLLADGERFASSHSSGLARIWSLKTGQELKRWKPHEGPGIASTDVIPLHNDRWLLTLGDDKAIRLWDGSTYEKLDEATTEMLATGVGGVSPDGRLLVTGAGWRLTTQSEYDNHHDLHVWRLPMPPAVANNAATFTNSLGMEFVRVPKGKSWLGGGGGKPGTNAVEFKDDFYLGKFEVTQGEWEQIMDGSRPSYFLQGAAGGAAVKGMSDAERKRLPVESVSWDDAQEFLRRVNEKAKDTGWEYRLPTIDEWEYACRGGPLTKPDESAFYFYFDQPTNTLAADKANVQATGLNRPQPVGSYSPNRLGLCDMHGNVRELCLNETRHSDGSMRRVVRGEGWASANRDPGWDSVIPAHRFNHTGLRVARVRTTNFTNSLGMEFIRVPKGKSWLGGGGGKPGTNEVEIKEDFYLGKYEVTQEEWQRVMGKNPSSFSRSGLARNQVTDISDEELRRFPVETISWNDAREFLRLLNEQAREPGWEYRLPTEDQWEYAARNGPLQGKSDDKFDYYFDKPSNTITPKLANYQRDDGPKRTVAVGSFPANRLGLHDMHGNVWEWCEGSAPPDPKSTDGAEQRILRGGSWSSNATNPCRTIERAVTPASKLTSGNGLRLARVRVVTP
jgi:formylglycine-generating enzyme required for sulfatase activity